STILNIADRDRLFSFISSSVGKIGLRVINLNGASKPSGTIGIPFGTGFCVDHFLNAFLHILSSKEWNVITETLPPIEITSAACFKELIHVVTSSFTAFLIDSN